MTVYQSGPFNIEQGNSAAFAIEFLDSAGSLTVPSSAELSITYVSLTSTSPVSTVTESVTLTLENSFYTGTWSSTSARLGLATWVAMAANSTAVQSTGQIRVLQRQSTY